MLFKKCKLNIFLQSLSSFENLWTVFDRKFEIQVVSEHQLWVKFVD